MNSKTWTRITALALFAALALPVQLAGQEQRDKESLFAKRPAGSPGATVKEEKGPEDVLITSKPAWTYFTQFTPDTGLAEQSAVYDPGTNIMIVFGGFDAGIGEVDTNAVLLRANANGSGNWSTLIADGAVGSPPARDAHTAVYDAANNRMIVFGGEILSSGVFTYLNDVWVLSDANGNGGTPAWIQLAPSGAPPPVRSGHTAVYDAANNRMIIFGGAGPAPFNDVWELSNANGLGGTPAWTQLIPSGGLPSGSFGSSAVYDPGNNIMTVFGGNLAHTVTNAVWTLSHANGLGGTSQWTNIVANGASGSPAKRGWQTAIYDMANNRMIIFGGTNLSSQVFPGFSDAWVLTNANGLGGPPAWTRLKPSGVTPGVRYFHTAVYDAVHNLMIVFAGLNLDAQFYLTWVLSDANGL
jgi:hypothetical protein